MMYDSVGHIPRAPINGGLDMDIQCGTYVLVPGGGEGSGWGRGRSGMSNRWGGGGSHLGLGSISSGS